MPGDKPTDKQVNDLLAKLGEPNFRSTLRQDPAKALRAIGWGPEILGPVENLRSEDLLINMTVAGTYSAVSDNCNTT